MYEMIKNNYNRGLWSKDMLLKLVDKGKMSKAAFMEITEASPDEITPDMDLTRAKETKKKELSWRRDKALDAGTTFNNMPIATDNESRVFIAGAALQAQIDPTYVCSWKVNGSFVDIDATTIMGIATAVRLHIQGCFDKERTLLSSVDSALTIEGVKAIKWE
jgi:hypothetical protein